MNPEDRRMKYPYTWSARLWNMPWSYHLKHAWVTKYYLYAMVCVFPIFWKITKGVNTPDNIDKWNEIHRKEFSGESH